MDWWDSRELISFRFVAKVHRQLGAKRNKVMVNVIANYMQLPGRLANGGCQHTARIVERPLSQSSSRSLSDLFKQGRLIQF